MQVLAKRRGEMEVEAHRRRRMAFDERHHIQALQMCCMWGLTILTLWGLPVYTQVLWVLDVGLTIPTV